MELGNIASNVPPSFKRRIEANVKAASRGIFAGQGVRPALLPGSHASLRAANGGFITMQSNRSEGLAIAHSKKFLLMVSTVARSLSPPMPAVSCSTP